MSFMFLFEQQQLTLSQFKNQLINVYQAPKKSTFKGKVHPKRKLVWDEKANENKMHTDDHL